MSQNETTIDVGLFNVHTSKYTIVSYDSDGSVCDTKYAEMDEYFRPDNTFYGYRIRHTDSEK